MIELSVVLGTYNRLFSLAPCLASIRGAVGRKYYEIAITDGGSTDGTLEYLREQPDVILIEHGKLLGPVKAYNDAFARCTGKYVAHLNDDLTIEAWALEAACKMLDEDETIGQVAIPYTNPGGLGPKVGTCTAGGKRYLFASFGVTRKELGERAGWYDGYHHYNGDTHLSMSIWSFGYKVAALEGYQINHLNLDNAVRGNDKWAVEDAAGSVKQDWQRWSETWGGWNG